MAEKLFWQLGKIALANRQRAFADRVQTSAICTCFDRSNPAKNVMRAFSAQRQPRVVKFNRSQRPPPPPPPGPWVYYV